jgi:hypothetical protein
MRSFIKSLVKLLPKGLQASIYKSVQESRNKSVIRQWREAGAPLPPPHQLKQEAIKGYAQKYGIRTLVETGTYMGDMVEAQRMNFTQIFSIELSPDLWNKAVERFRAAPEVKILQGDSGVVLHKIVGGMVNPALFWLDGHFSAGITAKGDKDCPIYEELDAIFSYTKQDHVILIDDARCFVGEGDYPTIEALTNYIQKRDPRYQIQVKDDIIRGTVK